MNKFLKKALGQSWKTTLASYLLAALIAVQPFFTETVDLTDKTERLRFIWRIAIAIGVGVIGKYAADSRQVKEVDAKVNQQAQTMEDHIDETT